MPSRYICRAIGCNKTIDHKGYCETHQWMQEENDRARFDRAVVRRDPAEKKLYQSARWRALRHAVIARDGGRCRVCGSTTRLQVDHIYPWEGSEELFYNEQNLQVLCHHCHSQKTAIESARKAAQRRGR